MSLAPIVVFAYNRPQYLKQTLTGLKNNAESADSDLYIYCDGPKSDATEKTLQLIKEVRELVRAEQWCKNVYIIESNTNKGLSRSVVSGVTSVINQYGSVIVLEDDIVPAEYFLKYMNEALELYHDNHKVSSISGFNFPIANLDQLHQTFFLRAVSSWSWATWNRAWQAFENDAEKLLDEITRRKQQYNFDFGNTYPYLKMLNNTIKGKVDSWAIKWYATCFLKDQLTLFPSVSMVKNIGFLGTNINMDNANYLGIETHNGIINYFESDISESTEARIGWQNHIKKHHKRKLNYQNVSRVLSKLANRLKLK